MERKQRRFLVFMLAAPLTLGAWGCASTTQKKKQQTTDLLTPISSKTPLHMPDERQKANVKLALAQTLENAGQIDEAIQAYSVALASDQDAHTAHRLAVLHDRTGKHEKAREFYDLAIEYGGDKAAILCDYGYSLYLQHDYALAETMVRDALKLREDFPRAHTNLALVLARLGNLPGALDEFRRAGGDDATARLNLAYCLARQERWQEAMLAAQDAIRSDPSSDKAAILLGQLQTRLASEQLPGHRPVMPARYVREVTPGRDSQF